MKHTGRCLTIGRFQFRLFQHKGDTYSVEIYSQDVLIGHSELFDNEQELADDLWGLITGLGKDTLDERRQVGNKSC